MPTRYAPPIAAEIVSELEAYIRRSVERNGGSTVAIKPSHRVKFHWPPHPISYEFHVLATEWTGKATLEAHGEVFSVKVARTPHGVFGRSDALWHEDRGDTLEEMLENLKASSEPLFRRQLATNAALERPGRFVGHVSELHPLDLLRLLYCEDRDVAKEAQAIIEAQASTRVYLPGLLTILRDRSHPYRRSAQWGVLDLFEDLPSFCEHEIEEHAAVEAMRDLIWDADDDYARAIFKAGVVLGGHVPSRYGGPTLIECLDAPSKIGRRSAIHGLFHVVEWMPDMRDEVVAALRQAAKNDPELLLRWFAENMANDIASDSDHIQEPTFADE